MTLQTGARAQTQVEFCPCRPGLLAVCLEFLVVSTLLIALVSCVTWGKTLHLSGPLYSKLIIAQCCALTLNDCVLGGDEGKSRQEEPGLGPFCASAVPYFII